MNFKKELHRFTDIFEEGKGRAQHLADDVAEEARGVARKASREFSRQRDRFFPQEDMITRALRERPSVFVLAALCLLALVIARVVMDQGDRQLMDRYE